MKQTYPLCDCVALVMNKYFLHNEYHNSFQFLDLIRIDYIDVGMIIISRCINLRGIFILYMDDVIGKSQNLGF